jgi:hypothetical protein
MKDQKDSTYEFRIVRDLNVEVVTTISISAESKEKALALAIAHAEDESNCPEIDMLTDDTFVEYVELDGYNVEGVEDEEFNSGYTLV